MQHCNQKHAYFVRLFGQTDMKSVPNRTEILTYQLRNLQDFSINLEYLKTLSMRKISMFTLPPEFELATLPYAEV